MSAKLIAEDGILQGLVLSFDEGEEWLIGRDKDACQLFVEDPATSRTHLRCRSTPEGISVENLSATYPLLINEEEVEGPIVLKEDDRIKIGSGWFRFYTKLSAEQHEEIEKIEEGVDRAAEEEIFVEESPSEEEKEDEAHETIFDADDKDHLANIRFEMEKTSRWLLKVIAGPNNGAEFSLHPPKEYLIGTDPSQCDIIFHDTSVSRRHAKLYIDEKGDLAIEDLESKNDTYVETRQIKEKESINPNDVVTLGTTSFVVYDREGEMHTVISPLLPSIVKTLQHEEEKKRAEAEASLAKEEKEEVEEAPKEEEKERHPIGAFILIGIITGLFVIVGIGTTALFRADTKPPVEQVNVLAELAEALAPFKSIKYNFNKANGQLLLVGHVLTVGEQNQLLYNLKPLKFVKDVDYSGIVIDEYVWREINKVIDRNPNWKGITIHSTNPGQFVISGYLKSRKEADSLADYINSNFPYPDLLQRKVIVEDEVAVGVIVALQRHGFSDVTATMSDGELTLVGGIGRGKEETFKLLIDEFRQIPGVRAVKNFVVQVAQDQAVTNISNRYRVTGSSHEKGVQSTVVINGRILRRGDEIDGMTVTRITPTAVFLERGGRKFRIDY